MNKFERIQVVRALGLNTEVNVLVTSPQDWAANASFLSAHSEYSLRTFRREGDRRPEPHFPLIGADELKGRYEELLEKGLSLIIAEPIDPAYAEIAGCLMVQADHLVAEVAHGPGTVRRVTHDGQIDAVYQLLRTTSSSGDPRVDESAREARQALRRITERPFYELQGVIFEFSWYSKGIGWKNEPLIFWEISGAPGQEALFEELLGREQP